MGTNRARSSIRSIEKGMRHSPACKTRHQTMKPWAILSFIPPFLLSLLINKCSAYYFAQFFVWDVKILDSTWTPNYYWRDSQDVSPPLEGPQSSHHLRLLSFIRLWLYHIWTEELSVSWDVPIASLLFSEHWALYNQEGWRPELCLTCQYYSVSLPCTCTGSSGNSGSALFILLM